MIYRFCDIFATAYIPTRPSQLRLRPYQLPLIPSTATFEGLLATSEALLAVFEAFNIPLGEILPASLGALPVFFLRFFHVPRIIVLNYIWSNNHCIELCLKQSSLHWTIFKGIIVPHGVASTLIFRWLNDYYKNNWGFSGNRWLLSFNLT